MRLTMVTLGEVDKYNRVQLYQGTRYVSSAWGTPKFRCEGGVSKFMVSVYMGESVEVFYHVDTLLFCESLDSMYRILGGDGGH